MTAIRKIAKERDADVLWPVLPQYVEQCIYAYPDIEFVDWTQTSLIDYNRKDFHHIGDAQYIPLRWQDSPLKECMKNKYHFFGFDYRKWKEQASFVRNIDKEMQLFQELGLKVGESFNLINLEFGCTANGKVEKPSQHKINIEVQTNTKNIYFEIKEGYSLFDWCYVIQMATTIHSVSTSTLYLFELLDLKAIEVHLYLRKPFEKNHDNYSYLLSYKNYILH